MRSWNWFGNPTLWKPSLPPPPCRASTHHKGIQLWCFCFGSRQPLLIVLQTSPAYTNSFPHVSTAWRWRGAAGTFQASWFRRVILFCFKNNAAASFLAGLRTSLRKHDADERQSDHHRGCNREQACVRGHERQTEKHQSIINEQGMTVDGF
jgi:hypothetical protein